MHFDIFRHRISTIYVLVALPVVVANAFLLGPFQAADEFNHFFRVVQISHGQFVGHKDKMGGSGGEVDSSLLQTVPLFSNIVFHKEIKVTPQQLQNARSLSWTWPRKKYTNFNNTVIYAPFFYAPAVLAVKISQFSSQSILDSLFLARLAQGLASIFIAYIALRLAYFGRLTLFTLLVLPMTLSLAGSTSHDGFMASCAGLAFALMTHPQPMLPSARLVTATILGAIAAAKIPYLPLSLLLYLPVFSVHSDMEGLIDKTGLVIVALCIAAIWVGLGLIPVMTSFRANEGVAALDQVQFLMSHPFLIPQIAYNTLTANYYSYATQLVGLLGWVDLVLPSYVYVFYFWFIGAAVLGDVLIGGNNLGGWWRVSVMGVILLTVGAIFASQYVTWTPVASPTVEGVAGRYFIVILMFSPLAFTTSRALIAGDSMVARALEYLPVLGAYAIWVVPAALISRYWG